MKSFLLLIASYFLLNTVLYAQCNANAGTDSTVCTGASIQLGGTPAGSGPGTLSYSWAPATGLSCTNCPNPILTATTNQTYTLTVTSSLGCTDDNSVTIAIVPLLSILPAITTVRTFQSSSQIPHPEADSLIPGILVIRDRVHKTLVISLIPYTNTMQSERGHKTLQLHLQSPIQTDVRQVPVKQ